MIILDTHIWIWRVQEPRRLRPAQRAAIAESQDIGVCAVSCWEVAKSVARRRLRISVELEDWFRIAMTYPQIRIIDLTAAMAVAAATLPGDFHGDPFDQMIVAAAQNYGCPLVTSDRKILDYSQQDQANLQIIY